MAAASDFRNPSEYNEVLFEMFIVFAKTDEFINMSKEEREHTVNCIEEIKMIVNSKQAG